MIFIWILIIASLLIFLLDQLIERMFRYEKKPHQVTPRKYGIPFEEIQIHLRNRAHPYGWWMPSSPNAPTLVLIHGWGRNLARMMPYIQKLHPLGYNLVAFDARGHGDSSPEKHPTVGTFSEDILAVVDFICKSGWVPDNQFGIVGLSVGGGAAINAAGWDQRVKAVITVGAFSHPIAVMKQEFLKRKIPVFIPWLLFGYIRLRFRIDFGQIAPVNNIRKAGAKILLIHSDDDETTPLAQGQALAMAGNSANTELWVVPGKGHSDCNTHPQFWEKVNTFLQRTLPNS